MSVPGLSADEVKRQATLKPASFDLTRVVRPNILSLKPYRCARDDYQDGILLDANENSLGHSLPAASAIPHGVANGSSARGPSSASNGVHATAPAASAKASVEDQLAAGQTAVDDALSLHRYPDPALFGIKPRIAKLRGVDSVDQVFLGVGSDEVLDLIQRVVGRPGRDSILICPPTYGMYSVCAAVNDLNVVEVPLKVEGGAFSLDTPSVLEKLRSDSSIKVVFLCSPGNPTGTLLELEEIRKVLDCQGWEGIVVVDEAYIDFAQEEARAPGKPVSAVSLVKEYKNLVVSQTLSKAFGLAAIRLGIAIAQPPLIQIMNNTKAPYNISAPTAHLASLALSDKGVERMRANLRTLISNRSWLVKALSGVPATGEILGSNDANFVLVQILDAPRDEGGKPDGARAESVYKEMAEKNGLVVRNRSKELGCAGCLRITVGTEEENTKCIELLKNLLA